jgi:bifunctional non-homologous end joining protein LigD
LELKPAKRFCILEITRTSINDSRRSIPEALGDLPDDTVIDGEVVALDESGRPDFHRLQPFTAQASRIHYFVFDLLILKQRDLTDLPLSERRQLLKSVKLPSGRMRISEQFDISAADMVSAVRQHGLEGVVAKRKTSVYEEGQAHRRMD